MGKKTPLYDLHVRLGGKIVEFGGFDLPVQYAQGIIAEHNVVRNSVGLFDVSHMGECVIRGKNAAAALQTIVTNRVDTMKEGQCRYTLMLYEDGGIVDDLLIYKFDDEHFMLVVNAANIEKDFDWIYSHIGNMAEVSDISEQTALIALQGPNAEKVIAKLTDISLLPAKSYYFGRDINVGGKNCLVSTTGYTGEKGYEIFCAPGDVVYIYKKLLAEGEAYGIEPAGLGARDTLRFESSMPLYGHELSAETKAHEVGLDAFIKYDVDFIGKDALVAHPPKYERIGLKLIDKGIAREHCDIFDEGGKLIGQTTSGGVCVTLGGSYAMARVVKGFLKDAFIDVRGRRLKAEITAMPFYKRGQ